MITKNSTLVFYWPHKQSRSKSPAKKTRNAVQHFGPRKALVSSSLKGSSLNYSSTIILTLSRYEEAVLCLDRAIEYSPTNAKVFFNRGIAHSYLENYTKGREDYEQAAKLDPNWGFKLLNFCSKLPGDPRNSATALLTVSSVVLLFIFIYTGYSFFGWIL
jgi:tetratricopeptide (TPR) repeat protein